MARSAPYQRVVSDAASWRQDQALNATIYILREIGPTGFLLKEEGEAKKFKVLLGDPHTCTCPVYTKEKDICKHICWVLLRKFRVARTNPVSFQLGLVEREINELLRGVHQPQQESQRAADRRTDQRTDSSGDGRTRLQQKPITEEDICPICQEEFLSKREPVTYCKYSCGQSIHIKCMKVWAEHQQTTGQTEIKCPFCRQDFGPIQEIKEEFKNAAGRQPVIGLNKHLGVECKNCSMRPIEGKCYKCIVCPDFHLCQNCFSGTQTHKEHSFQFRQKSTQRWRPAQRGGGQALPSAVINNMLSRDLTDEDYELLHLLESSTANQSGTVPEPVVNSLPVEIVRQKSPLLAPGQQCRVCLRGFSVGQHLRRLPCKHKFHKDCIDQWLLHQRATCPIDGMMVYDPMNPLDSIHRNQGRRVAKATDKRKTEPADRDTGIELVVPGIGVVVHGRGQGFVPPEMRRHVRGQRSGSHVSSGGNDQFSEGFTLSGRGLAPSSQSHNEEFAVITAVQTSNTSATLGPVIIDRTPVPPSIPTIHNISGGLDSTRNSPSRKPPSGFFSPNSNRSNSGDSRGRSQARRSPLQVQRSRTVSSGRPRATSQEKLGQGQRLEGRVHVSNERSNSGEVGKRSSGRAAYSGKTLMRQRSKDRGHGSQERSSSGEARKGSGGNVGSSLRHAEAALDSLTIGRRRNSGTEGVGTNSGTLDAGKSSPSKGQVHRDVLGITNNIRLQREENHQENSTGSSGDLLLAGTSFNTQTSEN